ncbi:MAG: class I SAM-dependent methyltransferase [Pseudobutyrivibrio sp.]|nr:class I SAM-dependent methyltransferase [Pseudobutyrivibrio sp.]
MTADYKNWLPMGMIYGIAGGLFFDLVLIVAVGLASVWGMIFFAIAIILIIALIWMIMMHRAFSYNGKRKMSKQIIDGIAEYVSIPDGGECLDVGCGSGALTIACAKKNPNAKVLGVDRWGMEYASFSKELCENNASIEKATNVSFKRGDATKLDFEDETFDVVTSNYVYHNIPSKNRQELLLETLRTLKKGGTFAIHDIMSKGRYGDMEAFVARLKDMGYEQVELIDTTDGKFMTKWESIWMELSGSTLLVGRK